MRWLPSNFVERGGAGHGIRLRATTDEPAEVGRTAFLGRRVPRDRAIMAAHIAVEPDVAAPVRGGVLLRTAEAAFVEACVDGAGTVTVRSVDEGRVTTLASATADPAGVAFEVALADGVLTVSIDGSELASTTVAHLATGRPGWFMGSWWGPVAVGEGHVDVAWVSVEAPA